MQYEIEELKELLKPIIEEWGTDDFEKAFRDAVEELRRG